MKTEEKTVEELINELYGDKECRQPCALVIFSRVAAKLADLSSKEDIYHIIGTGLHELVPDSIVIVNSFEEKTGVFYVREMIGVAKYINYLSKLLGVHNPIGMSFSINDEANRELKSGTLKKVPGGLYGLAMENIPKSICTAIEKFLNVNEAYAIGFTWKGQLFGSTSFLLRNNKNQINSEVIKTFVSLSSIALQRQQVEETLQKMYVDLEQHVKERTAELEKVNEELKTEIGERKCAIQLARETEEKYSLLVKNSNQAITVIQEGRFKFVNPRTMEISGYTEEELTSRPFITIVHLDDQEMVFKTHMERLSGRPVPHFYHFRIVNKEGNIKWLEANAVVINWDGKPAVLAFLSDITEQKQAEERVKQSYEKLQSALQGTIRVISLIVELRDPYTAGHQSRVTNLACAIAEEMGISSEQIDGLRAAGLVHDIGKIYIPSEILSKPGKLSDTEFAMVKAHSKVGYDIMKQIEFPWPVAEIVLQHHERIDGTGYPSGLLGKDILIEAKILAVADVVEAIASHRPYRASLGIDKALEEISQGRGKLYDSEVVEACLTLFHDKGFSF